MRAQSRHNQPVRILDAALATDYQRWQRGEARKSRLLSGFLLGLVALVLIVVVAVSTSRPTAAHGQYVPPATATPTQEPTPAPMSTAVSTAPEEKCPDIGAFCPRGFLPIAINGAKP